MASSATVFASSMNIYSGIVLGAELSDADEQNIEPNGAFS